jgi:hypothetical protein
MLIASLTINTPLSLKMGTKTKIKQRVKARINFDVHRAPPSTISTIGTAPWDKLLPEKADATITTVSGFYKKFCFVDKAHN